MENDSLSGPDRVLIILFALSILANVSLAVLLEKSSAAKAALEQQARASATISSAEMADLVSQHPPTLGALDAPITIVIFSDFECPYCRKLSTAIKDLDSEQKQKIKIVFRNFPLPIHRYAHTDAEITGCAAQQSNEAFWALYDYFYETADPQEDPTAGAIKLLEQRHDVNVLRIDSCLRAHESDRMIEHDIALGQKYGVSSTPTMFINGRRIVGSSKNISLLLTSLSI